MWALCDVGDGGLVALRLPNSLLGVLSCFVLLKIPPCASVKFTRYFGSYINHVSSAVFSDGDSRDVVLCIIVCDTNKFLRLVGGSVGYYGGCLKLGS